MKFSNEIYGIPLSCGMTFYLDLVFSPLTKEEQPNVTMDGGTSRSRSGRAKKGVDTDDARRRRSETSIQIRKDKKEEQIASRRRIAQASPALAGAQGKALPPLPESGAGISSELIAELRSNVFMGTHILSLFASVPFVTRANPKFDQIKPPIDDEP